jgi:hypothetical protein
MSLWMIEPIAASGDSRWLDFPHWAEVAVRAPTAAQARLVAGEMEKRLLADATPVGNESHSFRSGFEDEKLYWVRQMSPEELPEAAPEGPAEVLHARAAADGA